MQVLEPIWNVLPMDDDAELPSVLGALYAIPRKWYLELSCLAHLRSWGSDEEVLSLTAWLSGGDVRFVREFSAGHIFRNQRRPQPPPEVHLCWPAYNKAQTILTILPKSISPTYFGWLQKHTPDTVWREVLAIIDHTQHVIQTDRVRYQNLFRRDFFWFCEHFKLHPSMQ